MVLSWWVTQRNLGENSSTKLRNETNELEKQFGLIADRSTIKTIQFFQILVESLKEEKRSQYYIIIFI